MNNKLDVIFIEPNSAFASYQSLSLLYSARETPTWSLLLAQSCRSKGFHAAILDSNAENLLDWQVANRVQDLKPRLVCFVVYGQNPNSGSTNMSGAIVEATAIKLLCPNIKICFVGSHSSALPLEVLAYNCVDIVLTNEGVYALHNLLSSDLDLDLKNINGIGWKDGGKLILNPPERLVPQSRMEFDLPGYAWDLLPYRHKPFDLYRAHFWHTNYSFDKRTPFAAIYTSLGCKFTCDFCMINILNRTDNNPNKAAADFNVMRFWPTEFIIKELDLLRNKYGVETLRISDEMFFLNKKYYDPLLDGIIEKQFNFNLWAYSRIDTCREDKLEKFKKAGINWLGIGIESANKIIRREITKGKFEDVDIETIISLINKFDINVGGNYIFGFPNEKIEHLQETLNLALKLKTEFANFYCAAALPGSPLYLQAKKSGWTLPTKFEEYSFHSYECLPLPTNFLTSSEVLQFRDKAWKTYYTDKIFLDKIEAKFGLKNRRNIENQTMIKLKRKILGD